jgi:parvulin-like peptidyl-prolyl isomerase
MLSSIYGCPPEAVFSMPFSLRSILLPALLLALAVAAVGCGGGDEEDAAVPGDAVAVVGDKEISRARFDLLITQAEATFKARKQEFPKLGTPEYEQLKQAVLRSLIEEAEFQVGAEELGIEVSEEDVDKRLEELKQEFFQGNEEKYKQELEKQGLSEQQVRAQLRNQLLSERIFKEVTKDVEVTDQEVEDYYEENKAQFGTPQSRNVRHILVKSKAKADELYARIKGGADFAPLARKFSQDPSSAEQGGKFAAEKGATVPPFDKAVFSLKTGQLSKPVKTEFGWHIIEATSVIKPASTKPLSEVEQSIRQQLLQQQQNDAMNKWVADLKKRLAGDIAYAAGFKPAPTTTAPTTGGDGATTTG